MDEYFGQFVQFGCSILMKICFLARPSFDKFSVAIYNNMKSKHANINACFVTTNNEETKSIKNKVMGAEIYETASYIRAHKDEYSLEKLVEFEKKYDCAPIWKYIYTDRFLIHRNYEDVIHITTGLFMFFEEIFESGKVNFYYSEAIATLQCFIAYKVGKKYGVKYVSQMPARGNIDTTYHYFIADEYMHNAEFDNEYLSKEYTEREMDLASRYLKDFEDNERKPSSSSYVRVEPKIDKSAFKSILKRLIKSHDPSLNDPYSYMYYKSYKNYTSIWTQWLRYQIMKKFYHRPDYKRKYIYYPLHYQPEATTCVCAEKYEKQIMYIDSLAKSIPADTILYVKEHYAQIGHRELAFYKELKKYPNVVLISPYESSRKLIDNAYVVTTLTGTAGYEAMLLRKPVLLAGNMEYENAPGIIKVDDIYDRYLEYVTSWKQPSREDVIKYLCECFRTYSKGNAFAQNYMEQLEMTIDDLSDSLYKYLSNL